jgi:hypothetical protein
LIQNRKNILLNSEENFNYRNSNLRRRIQNLKDLKNDKIRIENERLGKRIIEK